MSEQLPLGRGFGHIGLGLTERFRGGAALATLGEVRLSDEEELSPRPTDGYNYSSGLR